MHWSRVGETKGVTNPGLAIKSPRFFPRLCLSHFSSLGLGFPICTNKRLCHLSEGFSRLNTPSLWEILTQRRQMTAFLSDRANRYRQPRWPVHYSFDLNIWKQEVWEGLFEARAHRPYQSIVVSAVVFPESKQTFYLRMAFLQRLSHFCICDVIKCFFLWNDGDSGWSYFIVIWFGKKYYVNIYN